MCYQISIKQIRKTVASTLCTESKYFQLKIIFFPSNLRQIPAKLTSVLSNPYAWGKINQFFVTYKCVLDKVKGIYCQLNTELKVCAADKETEPENFKLKRSKLYAYIRQVRSKLR